jgi:hypothetical protein
MPTNSHEEILSRGVDVWNEWRTANPAVQPMLAEVDLSEIDMAGVNLAEADLSGADLFGSDLSRANLKMAKLRGCDLSNATLNDADMYKVDLSGASLIETKLARAYLAESTLIGADLRGTDLSNANLSGVDLSQANLGGAKLTGARLDLASLVDADLRNANLAETDLSGTTYGSFRSMEGHYYGIRGLDTCYGNALFVRDARDQDYLDTVQHAIDQTAKPMTRRWKQLWFSAWSLIDYGRSLAKLSLYALALATVFGAIFSLDMNLGWGLVDYSSGAGSWLTPFYFSVVTYTTLGYGDITPLHWIGEALVMVEVVLGYATFGLLLSILADRVARRS